MPDAPVGEDIREAQPRTMAVVSGTRDPASVGPGPEPSARVTRATVMFVDIVGFTELSEDIGSERAYFAVTGAVRMFDGIARRHGGAVDKYLGDCVMVVFGHPVAIADPAASAAAAAIEMREALRECNRGLEAAAALDFVVGINTGTMVAGDVRGGALREFHVLGDAVNVAARLKAKAPQGRILVGPETHRETCDAFEYLPLGDMPLKGKTSTVAIFELVGSRARRSGAGVGAGRLTDVAFVGRARELAAVEARLDALRGGRGGVVLVVGEEGMGKSRLLAETEALPSARQLTIVHARTAVGSQSRPGLLLEDLLLACSPEAPDGADATVAPDPIADAGAEPEALAQRLVAGVRRLAERLPLVVVLEDLHRADPSSLALLPDIVAQVRSEAVLFLATLRPASGDACAELRGALGADEEIVLGPLSGDESALLIDAVGGEMSDDGRELVLAYARGHPTRLINGTFLEPALRAERERAGRHERRSDDTERRRATILFADITGFTSLTERAGAERAYPVVVGCLRLLDEIARKYGGTVEKYLGDCVMALFGIPEAIEDAPRAAVNAAIEMRRRVRAYSEGLGAEMRLDVHSGINTGLGIAGDVSGPLIREFAVMGEPVSVADELKDLAPAGQVYVGEEVYRATGEVFAYREVDSGARERRRARTRVFELLSQQERLHRARIGAERRVFSPVVGRDDELGRLRAALARVRDGEGGIVSIVAAAGLGKSRLLAELASSEEAAKLTWCEGRSVSTGRHLSFHAIVDLCRSLLGIDDGDDEGALRTLEAELGRLLPEAADEILPVLATLLGLKARDSVRGRLTGLHGDALEKLILRSVTQLLRARAGLSPIVVVMDDLHWADVSSIELLESLLRLCEDRPILFIHLFRPGFPSTSERVREQARARHGQRHLEIELRPLDATAARAMLNHLFRREELPHATRQLIEEKARGNPFYIEEVIRALADEGAVERVDGRFRATDRIGSVVIPGSIQELVMSRIDSLDLAKRQLLQTASVIGGSFHVDVLAEVVGNVARLAAEIDALLDGEFLVRSERVPDREYVFKHPLIQEVTYDGLLQTRRETLHRKVAEAIEQVFPEDLPGYAGMLAYHYSKGAAAELAEAFLFKAGADAARAAAPSEALHFFEEASKLYLQLHRDGGDPAKRALLERNIAQALYYRGRFLEAIEHFNDALRLLGDRVVEGRVALAARFVANLGAVLARLYGPGFGRRGVSATPRQRDIMELRYARAEATVTSQPTRHLFDSMDSLAFLQRIDAASVPGAARFYAGAAALFAFGGISFGVSRRLSAQARALVRADSLDEWLYERAMTFTARVLEGDWADEHEIEPALVAESVRNGQLWGATTYLGLLAEKRLHRGAFASAHACIEEIDQIWDLFQYDLAKTNHYYLLTLLPLERGDLRAAIAAADVYYDENPEDLLHILALGAKAKAETELGELDAAEETLQRCAEVVTRSSPVPPFHASSYHRSRLLFDLACFERAGVGGGAIRRRARKSARAALRAAAKVAWRRTEVLRLAGRYHALVGERRRAHRLFARSLAVGEALGARPETARTWAEAGRLLCVRSERFRGLDRAACLTRARDLFTELGLTSELERLDR